MNFMKENYVLPEPQSYNPDGTYMGAPKLLPETWQPGDEGRFSTQQGIFRLDLDKSNFNGLELKLSVNGNPLPIRMVSGTYQALSLDGNNSRFKELDPLSALYTRLCSYHKK